MPSPVRSNTVESVVTVPVGGVTIEGNLRRGVNHRDRGGDQCLDTKDKARAL